MGEGMKRAVAAARATQRPSKSITTQWHSPGPFRAHLNYMSEGQPHRHAVCADEAAPGYKLPALVDTPGNTHLFAAAPDLLAACEAMEAIPNKHGEIYPKGFLAARDLVRAAIAKAKPS